MNAEKLSNATRKKFQISNNGRPVSQPTKNNRKDNRKEKKEDTS